jgi:hypothetical protein
MILRGLWVGGLVCFQNRHSRVAHEASKTEGTTVTMSDTDTKAPARKAAEAKKRAAADTKAATGENPQREWIDTLLMAAVMTRSKKKNSEGENVATGNAEAKRDEAPPAAAAPQTTESSENARKESNAPADETAKSKNEGATDKATQPLYEPEAPDSHLEDVEKRYRRRRCEVSGCTKFARFNNACSGHGGRRLCSQPGCTRVAQFGHKCSAHGGVKYCSVENCKRAVQSRGFCKTHGGGVRCKHPGCEKGAISKGHCRAHGGGSRCAEEGCQKWAQRHGFCVRHSKATTGTTEEAPSVDSVQV